MEKMIGRDTRRPRRKNKTQTLRSRSRANGLLIPANNWDVSKMGGMSEEIDTAGGGEGREKKNKMGVFACTGFQLTMRTIPLPPRCYPPHPLPLPSPAPELRSAPRLQAHQSRSRSRRYSSSSPSSPCNRRKWRLNYLLVAAAAAFIARAVWGTKRPAGRSPPKIHSRGDLRAVETSRPVQASQALRRLSITRLTS